MPIRDLSRLKSQLLTSGLSQKDNPLFQIINQLIGELERIGQVADGSASGSGSIVNNTTIQEFLMTNNSNEGNEYISMESIPIGNVNNPTIINNYILQQICFTSILENEEIQPAPLGNINFVYVPA